MTALKQAYRAELHRRRLAEMEHRHGREHPLVVAQGRRVEVMDREGSNLAYNKPCLRQILPEISKY